MRFISLFIICSTAIATELSIDAEWSLERHWQDKNSAVDWVPGTIWQPNYSTTLSLQQSGFEVSGTFQSGSAELERLYLDTNTGAFDWTIGIKPQDWAYAHSSNALNWIDDRPLFLAEHYTQWGSVQAFCQTDAETSGGCGARVSGWWQSWDWQTQVRYEGASEFSAAAQWQFGTGGLFFWEKSFHQDGRQWQLQDGPTGVTATSVKTPLFKGTAGIQWTWPNRLTAQIESSFQTTPLHQGDWQKVKDQLQTSAPYTVGNLIETHWPTHQHLVRFEKAGELLTATQTFVWWPSVSDWVSETGLSYSLNPKTDVVFEFSTTSPEGILATIGEGHRVVFRVEFSDGIDIASR